uniref:Putative secreted protein n=1 Tax=Ixodes ricinus TaxID=34613 RepID=A0A090XES0_IXORI
MKTDFTALALTFVVASLLADVISYSGNNSNQSYPAFLPVQLLLEKLGQPCTVYHGCERGLCCLLTNNKNKLGPPANVNRDPESSAQRSKSRVASILLTARALRGPCPTGVRDGHVPLIYRITDAMKL